MPEKSNELLEKIVYIETEINMEFFFFFVT